MLSPVQAGFAEAPTENWAARLEEALDVVDLNVLRVVLYHLTGDEQLVGMPTVRVPIRGGFHFREELAAEAQDTVRQLARQVLRPGLEPGPEAASRDLRAMMEMLTGTPVPDDGVQFAVEELALDEFPRDVQWTPSSGAVDRLKDFQVVVIGAGIGGIAMGVMLQRLRIPYHIYERQAAVGGTWQLNKYPEARVDTPSYLYQFKFEKRYQWSEYFASQEETNKYLQYVADKHGLTRNMTFDTEIVEATWDEPSAQWVLGAMSGGERNEIRANVIVSASGLFSTPKLPDIPGLDRFEGPTFHTAGWDQSADLSGKKVGLIGNGSSGTQLLPKIADEASRVTVFQRTPSWIMPIDKYREVSPAGLHWAFENIPYYWNWYSYSLFAQTIEAETAQVNDPEWQAKGGIISERNDALRAAATKYVESKLAPRPDLIQKCLPSYPPLSRRWVVDSGWYEALLREDVDLVTEKIAEVNPRGVLTADGNQHDLDVLVLATGFQVSRYFSPIDYRGRRGVSTQDLWAKDGARAYLGLVMSGFPNLFCLYGPNGQPRGGGSYYSWAENWSRYIAKSIVLLLESSAKSMECREEVQDRYNQEMDEALEGIVWNTDGQGSYYVNEHGRVGVSMPWPFLQYYAWVSEPKREDFLFA